MLRVLLAYIVFFPAAFIILWRSRGIPRKHKVLANVAIAVGIALTAAWFLGWAPRQLGCLPRPLEVPWVVAAAPSASASWWTDGPPRIG